MIVDPSHAAGRRDLVTPLSLAAAAVGADGIIVEVHPNPDEAICDGPQQLPSADFAAYARAVEQAGVAAHGGEGAVRRALLVGRHQWQHLPDGAPRRRQEVDEGVGVGAQRAAGQG